MIVGCEKQTGSYTTVHHSGMAATCNANQRTIEATVQAYKMTHGGALPASLYELVDGGQLGSYPRCPEDGTRYTYNPATGKVSCPNHPRN